MVGQLADQLTATVACHVPCVHDQLVCLALVTAQQLQSALPPLDSKTHASYGQLHPACQGEAFCHEHLKHAQDYHHRKRGLHLI
jgi:hypothetical protein